MQPVKDLTTKLLANLKQIDTNDRKVQIAATLSIAATLIAIIKLAQKRNFWDEMPPYKKATPSQFGDPRKLAALNRCSKPSELLEIVLGATGPASLKPLTIQQLWFKALENAGDEPCLAVEELQPDKSWQYVFKSWRETNDEFQRIAKALVGLGIKRFDVCNIIGSCSPTFHCIFFGTIFSGAVPGGCYTTNLSGSVKYICNLCKTKVVFAEGSTQLNKYLEVINELDTVQYIIVYGDEEISTILRDVEHYQSKDQNEHGIKIMSFEQFMKFGEDDEDKSLRNEVVKRTKEADPRQCAMLIYTSGTTGGSKGCMISHDNIISAVNSANLSYVASGGDVSINKRQISFLPLSHIAGQILTWWNPIYYAAQMNYVSCTYYCRKDWKKTLKLSLLACQPTTFIAVPRMYEKFYEKLTAGLAKASAIKRSLFNFVLWIGKDYYYNTQAGGDGQIPRLWSFVKKVLCDGKIKKGMGFGSCGSYVSGGAPLAPKIRETFAALNMPIVDAYGMSETAGMMAVSLPNNFVPNAVGPVTMGNEIVIDYDPDRDEENHGEICYRGRSAMMGYIHEAEKTSKVFDDEGFIHTGDIGYIDVYDCLHITGRIKELIVTAGGENVAPVPVENYIKAVCPALSQVVMIGDKQKYCSVIVSVACEVGSDGAPTSELQAHAKAINPNIGTVEEAMVDPVWHQYIREGIKKYNSDETICVSNSSRIQYFQLLHQDLCVNNGTMSGSLKVKRHKLYDVYQKEMDSLYGDNPQIAVVPRK
eukprot:335129_1